jgi:CheY-like chemotaxis protein
MACSKDALTIDEPRLAVKRTDAMPSPRRMLYVEDNDIVREVTAELLAQDGRLIVACATAEEALQEFAKQSFDIVVTDVSLPVMSGIELARSILSSKPQMPIIIASGYDLDFGIENWGDNVRAIIKPFEASEIEALMDKIVKSKAASGE